MRKLSLLFTLLVLVLSVSLSQSLKYGYDGPFPDTTKFKLPFGVINNGLAVDPAGKVWIQAYDISSRDSIDIGGGVYRRLKPVFVFNPDGTQPSFSPLTKFTGVNETGATVTDTIYGVTNTQPLGYGAAVSPPDGNIILAWGAGRIWKVDYKTGQGIRRTQPAAGIGSNSPAGVAVNKDGEVFLARVLSGGPGQILNPDFSVGTQFASNIAFIGRAIAVAPNGNDVYVPRFTAAPPLTYVYHSDNGSLGPYVLKDSIWIGASAEAIAIHPKTGYVWFDADRRSKAPWQGNGNSFYAYNPATKAIVDSFNVAAWSPAAGGPLPRGIAFSPTGDTVYVGHFDASSVPAVSRFIKGKATSVERDPEIVPTGYALEQNFPNPFNPSTKIKFTVAQSGMTTLKVYDVMGREIATLVNEVLGASAYSSTFDARNLPSGTYIYVLTSGGHRLTNKMVLLK